MTPDQARGYIKLLQDNYRQNFGAEVLKRAQNDLLAISTEAMDEATNAMLLTLNRLPSIATVLEMANREEKKIRQRKAVEREGESAKEKGEYKNISQFKAPTEFGKMCLALLQEFLSGKITKETYLLTAIQIAEEYNKPEMLEGLKDDLRAYYLQQNKPGAD